MPYCCCYYHICRSFHSLHHIFLLLLRCYCCCLFVFFFTHVEGIQRHAYSHTRSYVMLVILIPSRKTLCKFLRKCPIGVVWFSSFPPNFYPYDAHFMRTSILSISQSVLFSKWVFFLVKKDMFQTQRQHVARGFKFQIIAAGNSLYHNVILSHISNINQFSSKNRRKTWTIYWMP